MMKSVVRLILRHFSVLQSFVIRHSSFVILFIIAGGLASGKKPGLTNARIDPNGPVEVVIPEHGAYTGAFMDFGDEEDDVSLETIEDFEQIVGKYQAIIASSSYWGDQ